MKLTRRGLVVVFLIVGSILLGAAFGARGLNAIAAPALVALVAAVVQVKRFDRPRVEREVPARAHCGDTLPIRLDFSTSTPFSAQIRDSVSEGFAARGNVQDTTIRSDRSLQYEVTARSRGEHALGPLSVTARDVLGLVTTTYRFTKSDTVLVRPRVHSLAGPRREDLVWLFGGSGDERGEFDQLRYYERGDPMRDIHWKSSAKQPGDELVVLEFTAEEGANAVYIAANADAGHGDAMAEATASIVVYLLEIGVSIEMVTPSGRVSPGEGNAQRERILDHLARTTTGNVAERDRQQAHVVVAASDEGVTVSLDGREVPFVEFAGRVLDPTSPAEDGASEVSVP